MAVALGVGASLTVVGNRIHLFAPILDRGLRFLLRLVGNRNLVCSDQTMLAEEAAQTCPMFHSKATVRLENGEEKLRTPRFGARGIHLAERPEPLNLLVLRGLR